jgi:hypothetical protein
MKNVTLDRTTILQLDAKGTDCALTRPHTVTLLPSPLRSHRGGLAIFRNLARMMGGTMTSEQGKGSIFTLRLPGGKRH